MLLQCSPIFVSLSTYTVVGLLDHRVILFSFFVFFVRLFVCLLWTFLFVCHIPTTHRTMDRSPLSSVAPPHLGISYRIDDNSDCDKVIYHCAFDFNGQECWAPFPMPVGPLLYVFIWEMSICQTMILLFLFPFLFAYLRTFEGSAHSLLLRELHSTGCCSSCVYSCVTWNVIPQLLPAFFPPVRQTLSPIS